MQDNEHSLRPNTDECLRFFTSLNIIYQCSPRQKEYHWLTNYHLTMMVLIEKGLWCESLGQLAVSELPYSDLPELCISLLNLGDEAEAEDFQRIVETSYNQYIDPQHLQIQAQTQEIVSQDQNSDWFYVTFLKGIVALGSAVSLASCAYYLLSDVSVSSTQMPYVSGGISACAGIGLSFFQSTSNPIENGVVPSLERKFAL